MDPLSITASTIAVIGAVQQGLRFLKAANGAPEGLNDLLDRVSRFESLLHTIQNVLPASQRGMPGLAKAMEEAQIKLLEVNKLVQYSLTKAGESTKVDYWQWLRKGNIIEKLKRQLDDTRNDLTSFMGVNNQ